MADRPIHITGILANGNLNMTSNGNISVHPGDRILWIIDHGSGVTAITAITGKDPVTTIFESTPHQQGANWVGDVIDDANLNVNYRYSIAWRQGSVSHIHDPIISVRPSGVASTALIFGVIIAALMLVALGTWFGIKRFRKNRD